MLFPCNSQSVVDIDDLLAKITALNRQNYQYQSQMEVNGFNAYTIGILERVVMDVNDWSICHEFSVILPQGYTEILVGLAC